MSTIKQVTTSWLIASILTRGIGATFTFKQSIDLVFCCNTPFVDYWQSGPVTINRFIHLDKTACATFFFGIVQQIQ